MKGAAVGMQRGIPNGQGRTRVGKEGHIGHAGNRDVGILHSELGAFSKGCDGSAFSGEVTGLESVTVSVDER